MAEIARIPHDRENMLEERAEYFKVPGAHLYTVLHPVDRPVARVLLVGPFASERHNSYGPWVNWARFLASKGVEVLRYDYRGVGESEGAFGDMGFAEWVEDVELLGSWFKNQVPAVPLVLQGLAMGALLASLAFDSGLGDALLLWSPPANANQMLRSMLVRWVSVEQMFRYGADRKPISFFVQEVERGVPVEVEGYEFSGKLWHESLKVHLPHALTNDATAWAEYKKPVRTVVLGKEASPLVKAGTVLDDKPKDFTALFTANWEWITTIIGKDVRTQ